MRTSVRVRRGSTCRCRDRGAVASDARAHRRADARRPGRFAGRSALHLRRARSRRGCLHSYHGAISESDNAQLRLRLAASRARVLFSRLSYRLSSRNGGSMLYRSAPVPLRRWCSLAVVFGGRVLCGHGKRANGLAGSWSASASLQHRLRLRLLRRRVCRWRRPVSSTGSSRDVERPMRDLLRC